MTKVNCDVCNVQIEYKGKGRKPKFCSARCRQWEYRQRVRPQNVGLLAYADFTEMNYRDRKDRERRCSGRTDWQGEHYFCKAKIVTGNQCPACKQYDYRQRLIIKQNEADSLAFQASAKYGV